MAWKQKLVASGIDESNMPKMISKAIRDLNILEERIVKIDELLQSEQVSDIRKGELEEERDTIVESVEAQEEVIESKISQWNKNKDMYKAKGDKLRAALELKKNGQAKATPKPASTPSKQQAPPPQPPEEPKVIELVAEEIKPTSKIGFGKIGVFLLLGVLSFGAYNYLKNND